MKKFRTVIISIAIVMIIAQLYATDLNDLSWSNNAGSYLGIIAMIAIILSMILANRHEKKMKKND